MRLLSIEEYKSKVLEVLVKIDKICRDNNIEYFLGYGTLIGAIRHNGFIPWDDDADLIMLRAEYDRLREAINNGDYGIKFIDISNNPNTIYPFGKVCDLQTHVKEKNFKVIEDYGAFVDIFPFDFLPEDNIARSKLCKRTRIIEKIITHSSRRGYQKTDSPFLNARRAIAMYLFRLLNTGKLVKKLDNELRVINKTETNIVGLPWGWGGLSYPHSYFVGHLEHEFEGYQFYIPVNFDEILRSRYGDYMKLPPVEQRKVLHSLECYIDS